jgi:putative lipoic acid-binding regulatory protein
MSEREEFYEKLKNTLDDTTTYPSKYLYKFIVPNDKLKIEKIHKIFNFEGAVINTKRSKTGKFISLSILVKVDNSEIIIEKYKEIDQIEGIISL